MKLLSRIQKKFISCSLSCFDAYFFAGFISACLLVLSFPPYNLWWLSFVGFTPYLWGIFHAPKLRLALKTGFVCMFFYALLGFYWVASVAVHYGELPWIVGLLVLLGFCLIGELQFLAFAFLAYLLINRKHRSKDLVQRALYFIFLPFLYLALDFLCPKIFPDTVGMVLYSWTSVIQSIELFTLYPLTGFLVFINLVVLGFLIQRPNRIFADIKKKFNFFAAKSLISSAVAIIAVFTALHLWGSARLIALSHQSEQAQKKIKISVIQANIGDVDKVAAETGTRGAIQKVLNTYKQMSLQAVAENQPDLVVWPETAYPKLYTHFQDVRANNSGAADDNWVADFVKELKTPFFFGGYSSLQNRDFNTAFLLSENMDLLGIYQKSILMPFGEYVPLGPLAPFVLNFVPMIADFGKGGGPKIFDFNGIKIGPQICYEGIVRTHSKELKKLGADMILNITNDSWFGDTTEPELHLFLTLFNSIEFRIPMLRATNTGITTLIDNTGKLINSSKIFEPQVLTYSILIH